ncbi:MAG: molybdenum cofactor biosynthesis protein B [Pirellulaceae bacterium]
MSEHSAGQPSPSVSEHRQAAAATLRFSVLTISDSRTLDNDHSGALLIERMEAAGHHLQMRRIVRDEVHEIALAVRELTVTAEKQEIPATTNEVLLLTGGTGISPRDQTVEAVMPLLEMSLPGFGELFRMLSYQEIGPAAMLSRAFAGRIGQTLVFALPGSVHAVRLAAEKLLIPELPHLVHHACQ